MPVQPLPAYQVSPQLLAYVMVSKYLDGLPLYRQEKIAAREGLELPRVKLARWLIDGSTVFQPLVNHLTDTFFGYDIAMSDNTGIRVLKEIGRAAISQSALWIRRDGPPDKPVVLVDYATTLPVSSLSQRETTLTACAAKLALPCCAAPVLYQPPVVRHNATG